MECPATTPSDLSLVAEAALELVGKLSDAERCAIVQKLSTRAIVGEGYNISVEGADDASDVDVTIAGQAMMHLFVASVACLIACFIRLICNEGRRYRSRNVSDQGSFRKYLTYRFGYWYTWTPCSSGIVLLAMSLGLLVMGGVLLRVLSGQPFSEGLWAAWLWIAAPDGGGSAETPVGRIIGLMISVGGMLVFALLLSVISTMFEDMLQGLREGIGPVIEGDHIVIFGYLSPMLQIMAKELCNANESTGGTLITILSPLPKPEVEEFLKEADGDMKDWMLNSTIVVRSGDARKAEDLEKVAVKGAKKVIVMSKPGVSREEADSLTINVLLTLRNNRWPRQGHCVVQCQLVRNQSLFKRLLNEDSQVLTTHDFIGELMVQCSRQSGLAHVIRSVFSFEGDEFYIHRIDGTAGRSFMELLFALPGVIPIGIMAPGGGGKLDMVPAMNRVLEEDEALCVLAEDDSAVPTHVTADTLLDVFGAKAPLISQIAELEANRAEKAQTVIICGWNDSVGAILEEVDDVVGSGSQIVIHSPLCAASREQFLEAAQTRRNHRYQNFTVQHSEGPLGARFRLEQLPCEQASTILVLADESFASATMADSQTMAVIVQLQDILEERGCSIAGPTAPVIMPQLLDVATEGTLVQTGIHNYVMSSRLAARIMAVICEVPKVASVIDILVKRKVCKFAIAKLSDYPAAAGLDVGSGVSFNDVSRVVALANEIVLGWSELGAGEAGPWEMNPKGRTQKRPWPAEARLVVLRRTRRYRAESLTGSRTASLALPSEGWRRVRPRIDS